MSDFTYEHDRELEQTYQAAKAQLVALMPDDGHNPVLYGIYRLLRGYHAELMMRRQEVRGLRMLLEIATEKDRGNR